MATTLTNLEKLVQHYARDNSLDIDTASSTALMVTNRVYRLLASMFPWPEFMKTDTLTSAMATGTEAYTWAFSGSSTFADVQAVEVQGASDFYLLMPPQNQRMWSEAGKSADGMPVYYMRKMDGATQKIYLRPNPSSAENAKAIRVTGVIEPSALTTGATTGFALTAADDALAMMIAADWNVHDGIYDLAKTNVDNALQTLQSIWSKEAITQEFLYRIMGV